MDYSWDCCRSAVRRTVPRGYDSSKLECVSVCVCACVCCEHHYKHAMRRGTAVTSWSVLFLFLLFFSEKFPVCVDGTWLQLIFGSFFVFAHAQVTFPQPYLSINVLRSASEKRKKNAASLYVIVAWDMHDHEAWFWLFTAPPVLSLIDHM